MKTFRVLPTDSRYQDLTKEQRELLWEDFLLDHPEIAEKVENKIYDDGFDAEWEALEKIGAPSEDPEESKEHEDYEEEEVIAQNFRQFVEETGLDIEYHPEVQRLLNQQKPLVEDDWEEVE